MRALLDTHACLWWILDQPRLSPRVSDLISDGTNELLFSAASGWEIANKAQLGKIFWGMGIVH
jgi:PIN domain nuclease of toxin-antitoxin system